MRTLPSTILKRVQKIAALTLESSAIQAELSGVLKDLTDMETGQRGYLLTGDPAYLQPYTDAKGRIEMDFVEPSCRARESDAARTITGVAVGVLGWIKAG